MAEHLPECRIVTMAEALPDYDVPEDIRDKQIRQCHDDCPVLKLAVEHGRELAAQYGW